jgi:hypothetical protein
VALSLQQVRAVDCGGGDVDDDLARDAAHAVERPAAPITTFLVGYAAELRGGSVQDIEQLAARAQALAEKWGGEDVSADDFNEEDLVGTE